jgi:hypothetical protein
MVNYTQLEIETAYHEAAHAVGYVVLGYELFTASRVPPEPGKLGGTHGRVLPDSLTEGATNWSGRTFTSAEIEAINDDITITLMGDMGEAKLNGQGRVFDANNVETTDDAHIVGLMTSVWPTTATTARADAEVAKLVDRARKIIEENWGYIDRVARELLDKKTLTGDEVRKLRPPTAPAA